MARITGIGGVFEDKNGSQGAGRLVSETFRYAGGGLGAALRSGGQKTNLRTRA